MINGGEVHDLCCLIRLVSYVDQFLDWFGLLPCWNLDFLICMNSAHWQCIIINVVFGAMHVGYMFVFGFTKKLDERIDNEPIECRTGSNCFLIPPF